MLIKFIYQIASSHAFEFLNNGPSFFRLVPEEEHALSQLFFLCLRTEDRLQRLRMIAGIPSLSGYGHRCRREVLYLFQVEVQTLGDDCQFGHVLLRASRMAADEVGDDLLAQTFVAVDAVEYALELLELFERRLAHDV